MQQRPPLPRPPPAAAETLARRRRYPLCWAALAFNAACIIYCIAIAIFGSTLPSGFTVGILSGFAIFGFLLPMYPCWRVARLPETEWRKRGIALFPNNVRRCPALRAAAHVTRALCARQRLRDELPEVVRENLDRAKKEVAIARKRLEIAKAALAAKNVKIAKGSGAGMSNRAAARDVKAAERALNYAQSALNRWTYFHDKAFAFYMPKYFPAILWVAGVPIIGFTVLFMFVLISGTLSVTTGAGDGNASFEELNDRTLWLISTVLESLTTVLLPFGVGLPFTVAQIEIAQKGYVRRLIPEYVSGMNNDSEFEVTYWGCFNPKNWAALWCKSKSNVFDPSPLLDRPAGAIRMSLPAVSASQSPGLDVKVAVLTPEQFALLSSTG